MRAGGGGGGGGVSRTAKLNAFSIRHFINIYENIAQLWSLGHGG